MEEVFSSVAGNVTEAVTEAAKTSLGERMSDAGTNTIICICVVFAVLIFISLIISLFGLFPKLEAAKARKKQLKQEERELSENSIDSVMSQIESKEIEETQITTQDAESENLVDDLELVAVIAAAIAASEGQVTTDGFVVRSIRKVRR